MRTLRVEISEIFLQSVFETSWRIYTKRNIPDNKNQNSEDLLTLVPFSRVEENPLEWFIIWTYEFHYNEIVQDVFNSAENLRINRDSGTALPVLHSSRVMKSLVVE